MDYKLMCNIYTKQIKYTTGIILSLFIQLQVKLERNILSRKWTGNNNFLFYMQTCYP